MYRIPRRLAPSPIVASFALLVALALAALLAVPGGASAASAPEPGSWTRLLDRPLTAEQLGVPASASARTLARAALRRSARRLKLRNSLRGLQLTSAQHAPDVPAARNLRTLRFRQTVGGLRVLYSQLDVAVVDASVTSISATVVPLTSSRLRGVRHVSAARARAIARRRIGGPDAALPAQPIAVRPSQSSLRTTASARSSTGLTSSRRHATASSTVAASPVNGR